MKLKRHIHVGTAAIATVALSFASCKKKEGETTGNGGGDKPKPGETGKGSTGGTKSVAELLNGYWAPNKEGTLALMKEEAAKSGEEVDAAAMAFAAQMIEMMADSMVAQFDNGKATMHGPEGAEDGSYKIASSDDATGEFSIDMVDPDGESTKITGKIEGDKMTAVSDGMSMVMDRIGKDAFAKRIEAIKAKAAELKSEAGSNIGAPEPDVPEIPEPTIPDVPDAPPAPEIPPAPDTPSAPAPDTPPSP